MHAREFHTKLSLWDLLNILFLRIFIVQEVMLGLSVCAATLCDLHVTHTVLFRVFSVGETLPHLKHLLVLTTKHKRVIQNRHVLLSIG